jgi:hypothetical protein
LYATRTSVRDDRRGAGSLPVYLSRPEVIQVAKEPIKLNELDDEDAIEVNAQLAHGVEASGHIRQRADRLAERLDEGDLSESDAEALED